MRAFASNVPIDRLDHLLPLYRSIARARGQTVRIRYRGPRFDMCRAYTRKEHARAFSVYFY